jgi:hypothetical protein
MTLCSLLKARGVLLLSRYAAVRPPRRSLPLAGEQKKKQGQLEGVRHARRSVSHARALAQQAECTDAEKAGQDVKRSKSVTLAVVPLLAAAFLSGCGDKETAYCVDQDNRVTDNVNCDRGNNSGFFWFFGGPGLGRGSIAGAGERINSTDRAALARRGGFGSSARSGGIGRPTGRTIGGGFSGGG